MTSTALHTPTLKIPTLMALLRRVAAWHRCRTTRRQLEGLTLEQLRDVGIDPDVVSREHPLPCNPWTMSRLLSLR